jgi:hypothetical protein
MITQSLTSKLSISEWHLVRDPSQPNRHRWTLPRLADQSSAKMAKAQGAYHVIDPAEEPEDLTNDDDVVFSQSSNSYLRKPSESFDTEEDIEDGFVERRQRRKRGWTRIWDSMTVRERRKGSLDKEGLFGSGKRGRRRNGGWYNCCVFGGISGLCILYVHSSFLLPHPPFLSPSLLTHPQSPPPNLQPPPRPRNLHLVLRHRQLPSELGTSRQWHRRAGLVPHRLHARRAPRTLPLA